MRYAMILILLSPPLVAQEGKDDVHGSFFKKSEIDFWGTASRMKIGGGARSSQTIFAEPVRMPDGRYAIYVPPPEVLAFLEEPTKENARAYLEWQNARSRKIASALEALETLKREESEPRGNSTPNTRVERRPETALQPAKADQRVRLTYFRQSG